jgi:nucleotide-binding universal stress UspA family protein
VKIKSMLARLQSTLGESNLVEQMLLLPEPELPVAASSRLQEQFQEAINLMVGYTGSPCSQTALDLTFWMAHQTRIATQKQVIVHVVYVVDEALDLRKASQSPFQSRAVSTELLHSSRRERSSTATLTRPEASFERADRILWQARCLSEEWRGSLNTHLRIGNCAEELRQVAIAESADVLVLGCRSARHPLISQWVEFPCAVLGIPAIANPDL